MNLARPKGTRKEGTDWANPSSVAEPNHSGAEPNLSVAEPNQGVAEPNQGVAEPNHSFGLAKGSYIAPEPSPEGTPGSFGRGRSPLRGWSGRIDERRRHPP
jgi:hypothetical protein